MLSLLLRYGPTQVIVAVSKLLLVILLVRTLDFDGYGIYVAFFLTLEILAIITHQWINHSLIRFYNSVEIDYIYFLKYLDTIFISLTFFISVILLLIVSLFNFQLGLYFLLFYICQLVFGYMSDIARLSNQHIKYNLALIVDSLSPVIYFSYILFSTSALSINEVLNVTLCAKILALIIVFRHLNYNFAYVKYFLKYSKKFIFVFKYGLPLVFSNLIARLMANVDRYVILFIFGNSVLGQYSAVVSVVMGVFSLLFTLIATPFYPELNKLTDSLSEMKKLLSKYLSLLLIFSLPITTGFIVTGEFFIKSLLGRDLGMLTSWLFVVLVLSVFLQNFVNHYFRYLVTLGRETIVLVKPYIISLAILVILMTSGAYYLGFEAVIISVLISYVSLIVMIIYFSGNLSWIKVENYSFLLICFSPIVVLLQFYIYKILSFSITSFFMVNLLGIILYLLVFLICHKEKVLAYFKRA